VGADRGRAKLAKSVTRVQYTTTQSEDDGLVHPAVVHKPSPSLCEPSAIQHVMDEETLHVPLVSFDHHNRSAMGLCDIAKSQKSPVPAREASTSAGLKVGGRRDRTLIAAAEEYPVPPNFDQRPGLGVSALTPSSQSEDDGLAERPVDVATPRTLSVSNRPTSTKGTMRVPRVKRSAMPLAVNHGWMLGLTR
jgi:hypothetical protein